MKQIKIDIPSGYKIVEQHSDHLILEKELPSTWEDCLKQTKNIEYITTDSKVITDCIIDTDFIENNKNCLPKGYGEKVLALSKLLICRDIYRDGWTPNWDDSTKKYHIYVSIANDIKIMEGVSRMTLAFQDKQTAEIFANKFKDLIIQAGDLI